MAFTPTSTSTPSKLRSLFKMGTTGSKNQPDLIAKAHELVARGRGRYPLTQDIGNTEHSKRLDTVITQLEEILREKKPPLDVVQVMCEQLAGLLDSSEAKNFYSMWEEKIKKDREDKEKEKAEGDAVDVGVDVNVESEEKKA